MRKPGLTQVLAAALAVMGLFALPAAAQEAPAPPKQNWSFDGIFETWHAGQPIPLAVPE